MVHQFGTIMKVRYRKQGNHVRRRRRPAIQTLEPRRLLAADFGSEMGSGGAIPLPAQYRTFDGTANNLRNDHWGAADTPLLRVTTVEYGTGDAGAFPALASRLDSSGATIDPRAISNQLMDQDASLPNDRGLTGFTFQWGQFIDHDMDLTADFVPVGEVTMPGEFIPLYVTDPADDMPLGTMIPMLRSRFEHDSEGVAQQINQITSYIDASNVYGSEESRAASLRAGVGGLLLTSDGTSNLSDGSGDFLPRNTLGLENAAPPTTGTGVAISAEDLFVAGDVRANEQPGLTSLHTLWVREHNFQAARIAERIDLDRSELADADVDEFLFQLARAITNAEIQSITYNEFLPSLLGPSQLRSYSGYRDDVNASVANIFSGALYRVGHTMLPNELLLLSTDGSPVADDLDVLGASVKDGQVSLGDAFFNPQLVTQFGIEPYLKGLSEQQIQEIDPLIVDGVRNLLFAPPAAVDLGATNLLRGRDHGLPDYNQARIDFGLEPVSEIAGISSDAAVVQRLEAAYDAAGDGVGGYRAVDNIDVFAGAVSEDHIPGGSVGGLLQAALVDQFTRLRDGDRFYFENIFSGSLLDEIQDTRLADIIRRNTDLEAVPDEVFRGSRVFTYRGREADGRINIALSVREGQLQVVDHRSHQVLAAQDLADTEIVTIYGTSSKDRIRVDSSVAELWSGVVELHGGGGSDRLWVHGTRASDDIDVTATVVRINDLSLVYGNIENLTVNAAGGNDRAVVSQPSHAQLTIAGGNGSDVLIGSEGKEMLIGGRGRDLLVGGFGQDILLGGWGQDLIVGGALVSDADAIGSVWLGPQSFRNRVSILRSMIAENDDDVRDYLFGGPGRDWLLGDSLDCAWA
jgi:peroxidase